MTTSAGIGHWQSRLDELAARHGVTGAQLGLRTLSDDGPSPIEVATTGVLNTRTGVPVAPESIFEIGSISKVWTTVLILQLVDEGLLALDAPVRAVLDSFSLADEGAADRITVRHLLCHVSGIDGDLFVSTGRGDEAVERYVDSLAGAHLIHPTGEGFSYCNSGFVIAGRIVEVLRGEDWDTVLRRRLIEPLGLQNTVTLPEHAIVHSTAIGHRVDDDGTATPVPTWGISRAFGPAGSIASTVHDQIVFATALHGGGLAENGTRILSPESAALMTESQVDLAWRSHRFHGWGLGWFLEQWGDQVVPGHDGGTIAQRAFLRILPETGRVFSLLTSAGPRGSLLFDELAAELAAEWGVSGPPVVAPDPGFRPDHSRLAVHEGLYSTGALELRFFLDGDDLVMESIEKLSLDPDAGVAPPQRLPLHPVAENRFVVREAPHMGWEPVFFFSAPEGDYVAYGHRTLPRVR